MSCRCYKINMNCYDVQIYRNANMTVLFISEVCILPKRNETASIIFMIKLVWNKQVQQLLFDIDVIGTWLITKHRWVLCFVTIVQLLKSTIITSHQLRPAYIMELAGPCVTPWIDSASISAIFTSVVNLWRCWGQIRIYNRHSMTRST